MDPSEDLYEPIVAMHEAVRAMLHAPRHKDDFVVARRAAEEYRSFYANDYYNEHYGFYRSPGKAIWPLTYI